MATAAAKNVEAIDAESASVRKLMSIVRIVDEDRTVLHAHSDLPGTAAGSGSRGAVPFRLRA